MEIEETQGRVPISTDNVVYERKFDIALRSTHSILAHRILTENIRTTYDQKLLHAQTDSASVDINALKINVNTYPILLRKIFEHNAKLHKINVDQISNIIERSLFIQTSTIFKNVQKKFEPDVQGYVKDCIENTKRSKEIANLTYAYHVLTKVVDMLPNADGKPLSEDATLSDYQLLTRKCSYDWSKLEVEFRWSRQSVLIKIDNKWYLSPRSMILLYHNKICDLLSVLVLAASSPDNLYGACVLQETVTFIKEFRRLAESMDQRFFGLSKVLESLVIGETLARIEGPGNAHFLNTIVESLDESGTFRYEGSKLQDILQGNPIPLIHELACLSKCMGHPFCDMSGTAQELYDRTHEVRELNIHYVQEAARFAKQDFVSIYINKKGEWPPVLIDEDAPRVLV